MKPKALWDWAIGIDRSDSNSFKISRHENLGTNDVVTLTTNDAFFAGRVAIGNTSVDYNADADDLIVGGGSGDTGITIVSGANAGDYGAIYFADGRADGQEEYRGIISYEQNNEIMRFHTNTVEALELGVTQNATFAGDVILTATKALYLDGGGGTYIYESSDGVIDFYGDTVQLLTAKQNGTQSEVVVNEGSGDVDFRVEANNDTHLFFAEAESTGKGWNRNK